MVDVREEEKENDHSPITRPKLFKLIVKNENYRYHVDESESNCGSSIHSTTSTFGWLVVGL